MINDQEESERYLSIAQKYLLNDDHRNALKYLYKSQQSFPSNYVKEMIGKVEQLILVSEENGRFESKLKYEYLRAKQQTNQKTQTNGTECDDNDNGDDSDSENRISNKAEYSEDQLEAVRRINSYKDYYQILNLTKDANEQDLKRQYRRLALQFHPDKNKAPGASDAFKAISSAFEVLGDPEKRRNYDLYGSAERIPKKQTNIYSEYSARFNRDRNMSSEELFNLFFGDTHVYGARHQWSADRTESQESSGISVFIQLLPVIVFVIMSIISSLLIRDPIYSLSRSTKYPYLRKTSDLHIPYFVKENFEADFKSSLREIEEEVNQDFIRDLKTRCFKERNYRENLIWKAKNIGDATFEERARRMKTPSCSELHELQKRVDDNI